MGHIHTAVKDISDTSKISPFSREETIPSRGEKMPVIVADNTRVATPRPVPLANDQKPQLPVGNRKSNYDGQEVAFKKDKSHKEEGLKTGHYDDDYDLVAQHKIAGASEQILDYKVNTSGSTAVMTIKNLGYKYYKYINENLPSYIGSNNYWLFNYLLLNKEKQKQTYFVPVTSCRYPNQLAQIRVFPDMKWTLLLKFNFKKEDWEEYKKEYSYKVQAYYFREEEIVVSEGFLGFGRKTSAGVSIERQETLVEKEKRGGYKKLLELIKRMEISLTAEWTDAEKGKQSKDVIEEYWQPIYRFYKRITIISQIIGAIVEGESNETDSQRRKELEAKLQKEKSNSKNPEEVIAKIYEVLTKKPVEKQLLYPSIGLGLSWYYADAYSKEKPELMNQVALEYNLKLEAKPVIGVQVTWDFIEMLARRHPIALIIVKVINIVNALINDGEGVKLSFIINGQVNMAGNIKYNTLSGSSFTNPSSSTEEKLANLQGDVKADLTGEISIEAKVYQVISEFNASGEFKIGIKTQVLPEAFLATDNEGLYLQAGVDFKGFTFYLKAEGKFELMFFGMKIVEWEKSYEPKPFTVGEGKIKTEKKYLIGENENE